MNEFREWLSDNLRYFMLGFAIIIIMVLLFFGFRLLNSIVEGMQENKHQVSDETNQTGDQIDPDDSQDGTDPDGSNSDETDPDGSNSDETDPDETDPDGTDSDNTDSDNTDTDESPKNPLVKNEDSRINALVFNYFDALSRKDVDALRKLLDHLSEEDETAILNAKHIEGYSNVQAYTKDGLTEGSYVVFVCYDHKYVGYETLLPTMSYLYLETDDKGSLHILSQVTEEQMEHINTVLADEDVQNVIQEAQKKYDDTLEADAALKAHLIDLGIIE